MKALLTLWFGLASLLGQAQALAPAPTGPASPFYATHDDSVALLRNVFRRSRRLGRFGAISSGTVVASNSFLTLPAAAAHGSDLQKTASIYSLVLYSAFLVQDIVTWHRYSRRREQEALMRLELHQPQPLYVERRLILAVAEAQISQLRRRR